MLCQLLLSDTPPQFLCTVNCASDSVVIRFNFQVRRCKEAFNLYNEERRKERAQEYLSTMMML
ncbi:unnamed protein product [Coffea canephora]|uniref:Uncharacterized protein n=1 Tax=Coffea canephora TaxID=49390 RepID=A0A068UF83_COFCA|nr:unnamed protein product [Coffea canephora]